MDHWKLYFGVVSLIINFGILLTVVIYVWKNKKIVKLSRQTALKLHSNSEASAESVNISKRMLKETKELRNLETSPILLGFFERESLKDRDRIVFILQNIGNGIATEFKYEFTPDLVGKQEHHVNAIVEFGKSNTIFPPNYQYKMIFGRVNSYLPDEWNNYNNLPSEFLLTINCINILTSEPLTFSYSLDLKKIPGVCQ